MEKMIPRTRPAILVEIALHEQRLAACDGDKWLMFKEMQRYESNPTYIIVGQKAGDPGENIHNHGCEARGI